ncbi:MAG: HEPN domain-containing protein [Candidatus Micrarchaeota archaeon]
MDLVRKSEPNKQLALELLASTERDLKAANDNIKSINYDWALAIAYNSMLSSGRALMANKGYLPVSEAYHLAVVKFCDAILESKTNTVKLFNRYRVRRHDVVYGASGSVGKEEAETAIKNAGAFYKCIKEAIK